MQSLSKINRNLEVIKKLIKVNSKLFYYKNINFFPLIKLFYLSETFLANKKKNIKKKRNKFFSLIKFISNLPFLLINKFFYNQYLKKRLIKKDVVFFSDFDFYYEKFNNKKINTFIDPYFRLISKKYNSAKLEIVPHWYKDKKNKLVEPIYLKFLYLDLIKLVIFKIKDYLFFQEKKFYNDLKILLKKYKIDLDKKVFQKRFDQIYFHSQLLEKILKKLNPKTVLLTCYYNDMSLSIILACKRLNIKTVDIQHGGFEPEHVMYKYWQKSEISKEYTLLPNFFWVWHKDHLKDKFYYLNKNHKVIEGGKLLIQDISKIINHVQKNLSIEDRYFVKSLKKYKKRILFCATSSVPACLIKSIKISQKQNKRWLWMIRLHPRHSNYKKIKEKLLKEKISFNNIRFKQPSELNLQFLIKKSSHVLVDQSSVVFDAAYLKKPVICINKQKNLFSSWDNLKVCNFSSDPLKIIKLIEKVNKNSCSNAINFKVKNFVKLKKDIF